MYLTQCVAAKETLFNLQSRTNIEEEKENVGKHKKDNFCWVGCSYKNNGHDYPFHQRSGGGKNLLVANI